MTHEEVIAKVRKLYALAQGNANENEAQAAISAAERLIQSHRLTEAEISAGPVPLMSNQRFPRSRQIWERMLLNALCKHYQCSVIDIQTALHVFGLTTDIELMRLQFERIRDQILFLAMQNSKGRGRAYAASYKKGLVFSVAVLLAEAKKRQQAEATNVVQVVALAKIDARGNAALDALRNQYPRLRHVRTDSIGSDRGAFAHGQTDGRHIHIGDSLGGRVRGLLS